MLNRTIITLMIPALMTGCAGAGPEINYQVRTEATTTQNKIIAMQQRELISAYKEIALSKINAEKEIKLAEITSKDNAKSPTLPIIETNADDCNQYSDLSEVYTMCLEMELRAMAIKRREADTSMPGINGNGNVVVVGSGQASISSGKTGDSGDSNRLIDFIRRDPFSPVPKAPPSVNQAEPWLNAGTSLLKTATLGFLGYNAISGISDALTAGASRDSLRIDGDYQSGNPVTTTTTEAVFAPE